MKKDREDQILDYVIRTNTELLKIQGELSEVKSELKEIKQEMRDGFEEVNSRLDTLENGAEIMKEEVKEINMKLDWAGEKIFIDHENRITALERR